MKILRPSMFVFFCAIILTLTGFSLAADRIFSISGTELAENRRPDVAINPVTGDLLVVWERYDEPVFSIWASFCTRQANGEYQVGQAVKISTGDYNVSPSVCFSPAAGRYMAAWEQRANANMPGDIIGQLFNDTGTKAGGTIQLATDTGDESNVLARTLHLRGTPSPAQAAFVIAFQNMPAVAGTRFEQGGVVTRLISKSGETVGNPLQALPPSDNPGLGLGVARPNDLAVGADNSLLIACTRHEPVAGQLTQVARLVRCGADRKPTADVSPATEYGEGGSVAFLGDKLAIFAWFREDDGSLDGFSRTFALPNLGAKSAPVNVLANWYTDRAMDILSLDKGGARLLGIRSAGNPFNIVVKKKGKLKTVRSLGDETEQYAAVRGVVFEPANEVIVVVGRFNGAFTQEIEAIVTPLK